MKRLVQAVAVIILAAGFTLFVSTHRLEARNNCCVYCPIPGGNGASDCCFCGENPCISGCVGANPWCECQAIIKPAPEP